MSSIPWIIIAIGAALILFGVLFVLLIKHRGKPIPTDYKTFFIMGVVWLPIGIATNNPAFFIMGLVFMAIGLVNKDKWEKNKRKWKDMDSFERKLMIWIMVFLGALVFAGLIAFLVN